MVLGDCIRSLSASKFPIFLSLKAEFSKQLSTYCSQCCYRSMSRYLPDIRSYDAILMHNIHMYWYKLDNTSWNEDIFIFMEESSWSWSYGSWIYNYLCNQCLSPLTLWVQTSLRQGVLDTTLCDKGCQWLATGQWFSSCTPVFLHQ